MHALLFRLHTGLLPAGERLDLPVSQLDRACKALWKRLGPRNVSMQLSFEPTLEQEGVATLRPATCRQSEAAAPSGSASRRGP